jgi:hypothetical protein
MLLQMVLQVLPILLLLHCNIWLSYRLYREDKLQQVVVNSCRNTSAARHSVVMQAPLVVVLLHLQCLCDELRATAADAFHIVAMHP